MVKRLILVLVLLGLVTAICGRYLTLAHAPFLQGADAYYYALQVRSFADTGTLKIPDSGLVLPLMGLTGRLGLRVETVIVLWTVFIQVLCAFNLWLTRRLAGPRGEGQGGGVGPFLLCAWALISPTLTFTCVEFPKYAFALAFLPLWGLVFVRPGFWPVSLAAALLSCAAHRTMIGVAGLVLMVAGVPALISYLRNSGGRKWWVGIPIGAVLALGIVFGRRFFSLADLQRIDLRGLQPGLLTFVTRVQTPLALKVEAVAAFLAILGLGVVALLSKGPERKPAGWLSILLLALVPLGSSEIMGLAERLVLALPLCAMSMAAVMPARQPVGKVTAQVVTIVAAVVLVAGGAFANIHLRLVHPNRLNPNYALYERVTDELIRRDIRMLVAHRGLNFYYKYRTMREAFHYEPESHWPKDKVWRVAWGISASEWAYYLPDENLWGSGKLVDLPGPYTLIREDCWALFRRQVAACKDEELKERVCRTWMNPYQKRPAYLYAKYEDVKEAGPFTALPPERAVD